MYKKIMVPLDGSELAECVLPHVEGFIKNCEVSTMVFVRAVKPEPMFSQGSYMTSEVDLEKIRENTKRNEEEKKSSAEQYLKQVVNRLGKHDEVKFQTEVIAGNVAESLNTLRRKD